MTLWACLYGSQISHSLSPHLHNSWFKEKGISATYLLCEKANEAEFKEHLLQSLHDIKFLGANFTSPFKEVVGQIPGLQKTSLVQSVGSANILYKKNSDWILDNTDVAGVVATINDLNPAHELFHACILGGGGAALASLQALAGMPQCKSMEVRSRNLEITKTKIQSLEFGASEITFAKFEEPLKNNLPIFLINTLPIGLTEPNQIASDLLSQNIATWFFDMIYSDTAAVRLARSRQIKAQNGLQMLKIQAAKSFEKWTGQYPNFT